MPDTTEPLPQMQACGSVFIIRCIPDPFTQERLNVGVCVVGADGRRHVKTITEPGRLQCLYGEAASLIVSMADVAAACALSALPSPSEQILFDEPLPFYNANADDMLAATFHDQVTVALPQREDKKRPHIDDETALKSVIDAIKLKDKQLLSGIIANTPHVIVATEKGSRALHIPFQPLKGVGIVRSADYSAHILKTHLLESVLNLECAARVRTKQQMGLFILRPNHAPENQARATDNVIDDIHWKAPSDLCLEVSDNNEKLAECLMNWAS
jgi:hypothetical protein